MVNELGDFYHGYTYSGHPVAAAAALENIRIIEDEGLVERVRDDTGPYLAAALASLTDHELVKVRARVGDRNVRDGILDELAKATGAELVQRIGHVALYYRPSKDKPGILLPA